MKYVLLGLIALLSVTVPAQAAGLQLSIQDGRVTLDAQDVTIRQILTEWARVGKTRIVNIERLSGATVTIRLEGVPERQALDIVLRAVPGYIAAPREIAVGNASMYHTILIMPTTTAVAVRTPPAAPARGASPVTRLRPPLTPGTLPEQPSDPTTDAAEDPIIAAAAAAGLINLQNPAATPQPGTTAVPLMLPGMAPPQPPDATQAPPAATPANPWSAPVGTIRPSLPTPASGGSSPAQPTSSRPPQADQ
jgi:hypothetical protein